jgi:hypothetical protein
MNKALLVFQIASPRLVAAFPNNGLQPSNEYKLFNQKHGSDCHGTTS